MPILFVLILLLVGYAMVVGDFAGRFRLPVRLHFDALTVAGVQEAMGHAFFTLSIGMGAIMAYGAYVPGNVSIPGTVLTIASVDTVVALAAGPRHLPDRVRESGLEAGAGPGLLFVTLPIAFGSLPLGAFVGALFFILVSSPPSPPPSPSSSLPWPGWWSSSAPPGRGWRFPSAPSAGCWAIGSVLSFNVWSDVHQSSANAPSSTSWTT